MEFTWRTLDIKKKLLLIINSCTHLSRDEDVGGRNCSLPASEKRKYRTNSSWFCSLTLERGRKSFSPSSLLRTHSQIHCQTAKVHHMENTEEKQNLLEESWTEVITEKEYLRVCTSALNRWKNVLKYIIWDLAHLQTVLKSEQSLRGRPTSFYTHTNPSCVIEVAYRKSQIRNACMCVLAPSVLEKGYERSFPSM